MYDLDPFFHDLKLLLWSTKGVRWITASARTRLEKLLDDVPRGDPDGTTRLLIECRRRLSMLEHIAGATPILFKLRADLERAIKDANPDASG